MTRPTRSRSKGFTLIELLVVISIIALLIAILLPALGIARRTAQRMENSSRLRGIHQASTTYANSNGNNMPGANSRGKIWANSPENTGSSGDADTVEARVWIMLDAGLFTPEYIISPSETNASVTAYIPNAAGSTPKAVKGSGTEINFSYAMLQIRKTGTATNGGFSVLAADGPRFTEWKGTLNTQAVWMSDRNTGSDATTKCKSIHVDDFDEWGGSVVWGDGHAGYENERYFETRYANGGLNRATSGTQHDNLFADANIGTNTGTNGGPAGSNAMMVARGNATAATAEDTSN